MSIRPANNNFLTVVQLSTKSDAFYRPIKSAVSNNIFSTYFTEFLKLHYRDIVGFRTKIERMRSWSLTHCKLHVSRCDVEKYCLIIFKCPCDTINTFLGKVPA